MGYLEEIYAEMARKNEATEEYFETESRLMLVEEKLRELLPGKLCDVGCGRGLVLRRLKNHHTCYGVDFDPGAVQYCQSQELTVQQIDLNGASQLPFPGVMFDVMLISEVMEHLLEPKNALRVIRRHLRPGGTLVVTVPNAVPLCSRLKLLFGRTDSWLHYPSRTTIETGHIRFYTRESMSRLLREEGFAIEAVYGVIFRWNGLFFGRLCYWLPRFFGVRSKTAPTKIDLWLGKMMPGFSPGLLFVCKQP